MLMRKILMSPVIGLLITVFAYNMFLPAVCVADTVVLKKSDKDDSSSSHTRSGVIVSMGDSYSAGEGMQPFYGSRDSEGWALKDWAAHRSQEAWSGGLVLPEVGSMYFSRYSEESNPHWYFVAASGAVTWNITGGQDKEFIRWDADAKMPVGDKVTLDPQIDIFKETQRRQIVPDYITMTMGGNDLGFQDILTTAATNDLYIDPCMLTVKLEMAKHMLKYEYPNDHGGKDKSVSDRLNEVFHQVNEAASIGDDHPCILVAGYPHLLNENPLNLKPTGGDVLNYLTIFTPFDAHKINEAIDEYNKELQSIVEACQNDGIRIWYVDVKTEFEGHEVNTPLPWINGIVFNSSVLGMESINNGIEPAGNQDLDYGIMCGASLHPNIEGATYGYEVCFQNMINELEGLDETPSLDSSLPVPIVGAEVAFGNYAGEDIQWTIMDETDEGYFLLANNVIETRDYNDDDENTTWADCSLREWLNGEFYDSAFNEEEKAIIRKTNVKNPDNPEWLTGGGGDTEDRVFLLSYYEAEALFNSNEARIAAPTTHAYGNAEVVNAWEDSYALWWLRSPGKNGKCAAYVSVQGEVDYNGFAVADGYDGISGVRPALWISKNPEPSAIVLPDPVEGQTWTRDGDRVIFGHYEQDGNLNNGAEPIEWKVLSEEDGKLMLISKYILDSQPYNTENETVTWETCSLRAWLNNDFLNSAFTSEEQDLIQTTTLSNPDNPVYGIDGGNDTSDKVFCLTVDEAIQLFDNIVYPDDPTWAYSQSFMAEVTQYAVDNNVRYDVIEQDRYERLINGPYYYYLTEDVVGVRWGDWWLRSPGGITYFDDIVSPDNIIPDTHACYVSDLGDLCWDHCFNPVDTNFGVRPVIWLDTAGADAGTSTTDPADPSNPVDPGQIPVVQNASQGLEIEDYFMDNDKHVPAGSAYVSGIGTCTDRDLVIPSVAPDGKVVAVIGDYSLEECDFIETVVIPDTVTVIMNHAFAWDVNIRSITLSDNLELIGPYAFASCHSLESIDLPEGIGEIRSYCFNTCSSLTSITIPSTVKDIYHHAFNYCTSLEHIDLPQGLERIGPGAFRHCTSLTSINIPAGTQVSREAFVESGIQTINGMDAQTWIAQNGVELEDD